MPGVPSEPGGPGFEGVRHGRIGLAGYRPAPGQDPNAVYALGSSPAESARLQRQADELAANSRDLLDRVGLRPGQAVIDLGCGPRGILDMLAERAAPGGRVVGLDADPAHAAMAAEFAAGRGLSGVQRTGGMASISGMSWVTSLRLPPVSDTASGMPCASVITWCFEPGRARSTGLGPVLGRLHRPHMRAVASSGTPRPFGAARS